MDINNIIIMKLFIYKSTWTFIFQCRHCGKAFASHAAHDSHVRRTHTKEKTFSCSICGKGFVQQYELKLHMSVHSMEWSIFTLNHMIFNSWSCLISVWVMHLVVFACVKFKVFYFFCMKRDKWVHTFNFFYFIIFLLIIFMLLFIKECWNKIKEVLKFVYLWAEFIARSLCYI